MKYNYEQYEESLRTVVTSKELLRVEPLIQLLLEEDDIAPQAKLKLLFKLTWFYQEEGYRYQKNSTLGMELARGGEKRTTEVRQYIDAVSAQLKKNSASPLHPQICEGLAHQDGFGWTFGHYVANFQDSQTTQKYIDLLKTLLNKGAPAKHILNLLRLHTRTHTRDEYTFGHIVAAMQDRETLQQYIQLLKALLDTKQVTLEDIQELTKTKNKAGYDFADMAIEHDGDSVIIMLLESGILDDQQAIKLAEDHQTVINGQLDEGIFLEGSMFPLQYAVFSEDSLKRTVFLARFEEKTEGERRKIINAAHPVNNKTALDWASQRGDAVMVTWLLKQRAAVTVESVHMAIEGGHREVCQALFAEIGKMDKAKRSTLINAAHPVTEMRALEWAVERNDTEALGCLFELGANVTDESVLRAIDEENCDVCNTLLSKLETIPEKRIEILENLPAVAALHGRLDVLKLLEKKVTPLAFQVLVNQPFSRDKRSPLAKASANGHCRVIEFLLDNGADINGKTEKVEDTPLYLAVINGQQDAADLLIKRGAANKENTTSNKITIQTLRAVIDSESKKGEHAPLKTTATLLHARKDLVNTRAKNNNTFLHRLLSSSHEDVSDLIGTIIKKLKAETQIVNENGRIPLRHGLSAFGSPKRIHEREKVLCKNLMGLLTFSEADRETFSGIMRASSWAAGGLFNQTALKRTMIVVLQELSRKESLTPVESKILNEFKTHTSACFKVFDTRQMREINALPTPTTEEEHERVIVGDFDDLLHAAEGELPPSYDAHMETMTATPAAASCPQPPAGLPPYNPYADEALQAVNPPPTATVQTPNHTPPLEEPPIHLQHIQMRGALLTHMRHLMRKHCEQKVILLAHPHFRCWMRCSVESHSQQIAHMQPRCPCHNKRLRQPAHL